MRLNIDKALVKDPRVLLVLSFCTLVLLKALLSLKFESPWFLPDEVAYSKAAANMGFGSVYQGLPQGYPFFLSIAYPSSENMVAVYHSMLLINSFISSLIIFPTYFILNKYCSNGFSLMGAITIATLPSLTLYTFLIMTENLFVPLFVFSIWFLLEAYETERPFWIVLAISSVSLLFFTRHTGIFMLAAMAFSLIYYLLFGKLSGDVRQRVLSKRTYIIFIVLFISSLALFGLVLIGSDQFYYIKWFHNYANAYGQMFLNLFGDVNSLKDYLVLLQNEIGYLIVASYFIFSYLFIKFFSDLFFASGRQSSHLSNSGWFTSLGKERRHALKSVGIYYLLSSVFLILTTTMSVYHEERELVGRYIDPIIPGLFLFGLVGVYQMHKASEKPNYKTAIILASIFSIIFFFNFPTPQGNALAIFHANFLKIQCMAPNWIAYPALAAGFFLLLNLCKNLGGRWRIFFAILLIFSVCASAYTYYGELIYQSENNRAENQIGSYLNAHSSKDSLIIMDTDVLKNDWYFVSMTNFWTKSEIIYQPVKENLSGLKSDKKEIYIITLKVLPLKPLAVSTRGYYLYRYNS